MSKPYVPPSMLAGRELARQNAINTARDTAMPTVAKTLGDDAEDYDWLKPDLRAAMSLSGAPKMVKDQVSQAVAQKAMKSGAFVGLYTGPAKPKKRKFDWTSPMDIIRTGSRYATAAFNAPMEVLQNVTGAGFDLVDKYGVSPTGVVSPYLTDKQKAQWGKGFGGAVEAGRDTLSKLDKSIEATTLAQAINSPFSEQGTGWFMGKQIVDKQADLARQARGTDSAGQAWTLGRYTSQQAVNGGLVKQSDPAARLLSGTIDFAAAISLDPVNVARSFTAPLEGGTAAARGMGFVGNSIYDARKAKAAATTAQVGDLVTQARKASQLADVAETTAEAGQAARRVLEAAGPAGRMMGPGVVQQVARVDDELEKAAQFRKYANDLVDYAEEMSGIKKLLGQIDEGDAKIVRAAAGLIENPKTGQQIFQPDAMKMLLSKGGRRMVHYLTEESSPTRIMSLWGGQMPARVAKDLADATTHEEVIAAIGRGLTVKGGMREFKEFGRWGNARVWKLDKLASSRWGGASAGAWDAFLDFSNPDEAVSKAYKLLGTAKVVGEERNQIVDELITGLTSGNRGAFHAAARGVRDPKAINREIKAIEEALATGLGDPGWVTAQMTRLKDLQDGQRIAGALAGAQNAIASKLKEQWLYTWAAERAEDATAAGNQRIARKLNAVAREADVDFIFKTPSAEMDKISHYATVDPRMMSPEFNNGPLRWTQLFNRGVYLIDPDKVAEVQAKASSMSRLLLGQQGSYRRMPLVAAEAFQEKVWRGLVILRPALGVRMLAEEAMRTSFGGSFRGTGDLLAAAVRSSRSLDALGLEIDAPAAIARATKRIATLEKAAGNEDEIRMLQQRIKELEGAFAEGKRTFAEVTAGKRSSGWRSAMERKFGHSEDQAVRSGHWELVPHPRTDPRYGRRYVKASMDELITQAADPVYKRIANGGLLPGDRVGNYVHTVDDVPNTEDIVKWLDRGAGRKFWDEYAANNSWDPADTDKLRKWVADQTTDFQYHFGNDEAARSAIISGYMGKERIVAPDKYGKSAHGPELRKWAQSFKEQPYAPDHIRYEMGLSEIKGAARRGDPKYAAAWARYQDGTNFLFRHIYSEHSDRLYRVPMFAERYWQEMEGLIPKLAPAEAKRLLANVEKQLDRSTIDDWKDVKSALRATQNHGVIDDEQYLRIKRLAESAAGDGTLEDADQLAKGWAIDDVKKLFFKADDDPYALDQARLVFPFIRAFAEVFTTWARIGVEDPTVIHSIDKGMKALRGGDTDPATGVFHTDVNGEEVFTIPLTGALSQLIADVNSPMQAKVAGLSIAGTILPGQGPVASLPGYFISQHSPLPKSMVSALYPYGPPESLTTAAIPPWMEKILSGWNQDETDQVFGNTYFRTLQYLMTTGEYGRNPADQAQMLEDAKGKTRALTMLRGLVQAFSPSAPIPTYVSEAGGDVLIAKMAADFRNMIDNPDTWQSAGYDDPESAFLAKYGERNVAAIVSRTTSAASGLSATTQFQEWAEGDGSYARKTHNLVYGYLGPQGGDFDINAYVDQIDKGERKKRTPNDLLADANVILARNILEEFDAKGEAFMGEAATPAKKKALDAERKKLVKRLAQEFPGFNPEAAGSEYRANLAEKRQALEDVAADERLVKDNKTAANLRRYFQQRATAEAAAAKLGVTLNAKKAAGIAEWLQAGALEISRQDEGFAKAWSDVLSREFKFTDDGGK